MRLAVLDDYQHVAMELADWDRLDARITVFHDTLHGQALIQRLRPFEVLCLMRERTPLTAEVINSLPNLRLIVTTGRRNASIDTDAAAARGIVVSGTDGRPPATAQLAMTLILAASRGLMRDARAMRDGGWQSGLGRDLHGLKLGLIGLGRLGTEVARLAQAFGMDILAWSENLTATRCAEAGVAQAPSLGALLAQADVVSIHLVLSARTRGLIGSRELRQMKPDALLVNTSRGPIVDEVALLSGLRSGRPGFAAVDVYTEEPLSPEHLMRDRDLIDSGRLLLTPHIGYVSRQTYELFFQQTVEAVEAWRNGSPVRLIR